MRIVILYISIGLFGLVSGSYSALSMSGLLGKNTRASFADINVDGWTSDWSIGATSADAYTRARVARHGLLALAKEEAIYFLRNTDDDGDPLSERCVYELTGGHQDAFWWSITLYDSDSRLPLNDDEALSIDDTTVGIETEWKATISPIPVNDGHWISSRAAGQFDLTLRLYRPAKGLLHNPEQSLTAPQIRKVRCEEAL